MRSSILVRSLVFLFFGLSIAFCRLGEIKTSPTPIETAPEATPLPSAAIPVLAEVWTQVAVIPSPTSTRISPQESVPSPSPAVLLPTETATEAALLPIPSTPSQVNEWTQAPVLPSQTPITPAPQEPTPSPSPTSHNQIERIFGVELLGGESDGIKSQVYDAGIAWVRRNALHWGKVEPQEGDRLWDERLERGLAEDARSGAQTILIVRDTPLWAQKVTDAACGPVKKSAFEPFARFLQDAVRRYSQPPYSVKYWEIWNEPDVVINTSDWPFGCWGDASDPLYGGEYYARMLKAIYPVIKSADPAAQVLIGGLLLGCNPAIPETCADPRPARFLEGILDGGGGSSFDGIAFHAYDYYHGILGQYGNSDWGSNWNTNGPVLLKKVAFLNSILNQYGISGKYLLNTEVALLNTTGLVCDAVCEETKAYYLVQASTAALAAGLRANIWYSATGWRDSGLFGPGAAPLPSYHALGFLSSVLSDAVFNQTVPNYPGVNIFELAREGRKIWVVWSQDGSDHILPLPAYPQAIFDAFGAPIDFSNAEINVTLKPVYILF